MEIVTQATNFDLYSWLSEHLYKDNPELTLEDCTFDAEWYKPTLGGNMTFTRCVFSDVTIRKYQGKLVFKDCTFINIRMSFTEFYQAVFESCTFVGCRITNSHFENCQFIDTDMTCFIDCTYEHDTLINVSAIGTIEDMEHCSLIKCGFKYKPLLNRCLACKKTTKHPLQLGKYCEECIEQKNYSRANTTVKGKQGKLPTFSFEFEVEYDRGYKELDQVLDILLEHGFLRCSDSSVDDEFKSVIFCDCRAFNKAVKAMERLTDICVSTHLHIGCTRKRDMRDVYQWMFQPLINHMRVYGSQTQRIWGRRPNHWAAFSHSGDRYNWINFYSEHNTVEFRLCKFTSIQQYKQLVLFCRTIVGKFESEYSYSHDVTYYQKLGTWIMTEYRQLAQQKGKYAHV